jgi:hypothetical protein
MSIQVISEIWFVPVLKKPFGNKKPIVYYEHMSPTRKGAVEKLIMNSYSGVKDWQYRKKLGWTIEKIVVQDIGTYLEKERA